MKNIQTVVVKIGSSVIFSKRNKLDEYRIAQIADQITSLREANIGVVLIISGAVASGSRYINITDQISRRMAAGIGQVIVISIFSQIFNQKGCHIAQMLLTKTDLNSHQLVDVIHGYVSAGIIPVINENDVVELNSFNGNDFLGAEITMLLQSKIFIILSTMKGSIYGVGGGATKQEVVNLLRRKQIHTTIVNGKVKNIILKTIL